VIRGARRAAAIAVVGAVTLAASTGCGTAGDDRQGAVDERGAEVMGFDLDATTHRFSARADGLDQEVVVDDPADREQVALIRAHLAEERRRFAAGDFDDPAAIHGEDMPGLADLRAGAAEIEVVHEELPDGAALRYRTRNARLVDALHRWGDAQVADHGAHAEHGDAHHDGRSAG
jgi:hypothetical protein